MKGRYLQHEEVDMKATNTSITWWSGQATRKPPKQRLWLPPSPIRMWWTSSMRPIPALWSLPRIWPSESGIDYPWAGEMFSCPFFKTEPAAHPSEQPDMIEIRNLYKHFGDRKCEAEQPLVRDRLSRSRAIEFLYWTMIHNIYRIYVSVTTAHSISAALVN